MALLSKYIENTRIKMVEGYIHGNVLDLGCGPAKIYSLFKTRIDNYYGIEYTENYVQSLKKNYPEVKFFIKDLDEDALEFELKFDCVLLIALIEHIFNQKHLMKEILKCLRPDGKIIITTPTPFGNDLIHRLGSFLGLFSQEAVDDHIVIYDKKRFLILAEEFDLEIYRYELFEFGCNQLVILQRKSS